MTPEPCDRREGDEVERAPSGVLETAVLVSRPLVTDFCGLGLGLDLGLEVSVLNSFQDHS